MQAVARTSLNKVVHDLFNIAWPMLLFISIAGPLYYLATRWLDANQMTSLNDAIRMTSYAVIKLGAVLMGGILAWGLSVIAMALYTGVRTVRQCIPSALGCMFFAVLYYLLLTA